MKENFGVYQPVYVHRSTVLSADSKQKSFRSLELVTIFYFLSKGGSYGKLYRIQ